jgi:hypothetical protein
MKRIARLLAKQVSLLAIAPILFAVCRVAGAAGEPAVGMVEVQHTNQAKARVAGREQALKLLDQYQATRSQLRSFIFKGRGSDVWDAHYTPGWNQSLSGHRTLYQSEELRMDGDRYKLCQNFWGPWPSTNYPESDPQRRFSLWDGTNAWAGLADPSAGPGTSRPRANRYILYVGIPGQRNGTNDIMGVACHAYFLLGYFPRGKARIDLNFRQASSISVREKTEMVDGAACYVIDAVTKSGRGSIWLDPEHGYLIAKAEYHVKAGDFYNERIKTGTVMDFKLYDVRFKKVNDTWVTVAGTEESNKVWLPDGYEHYKESYVISEITLHPDFSTLPNAFALEDVHEGAKVQVASNRKGNFVWRNGKIQAGP